MVKKVSLITIILLSCLAAISVKAYVENPFIVVYTESDKNLSSATKNNFYKVLKAEKQVSNMPEINSQDALGACRAFSLRTLLQKNLCDSLKVVNCKNVAGENKISAFGMMGLTFGNADLPYSLNLDPNSTNASLYANIQILRNVKEANLALFTEKECANFNQLVNSFTDNDNVTEFSMKRKEEFFKYLENLYKQTKGKTEADIADCPECVNKINLTLGSLNDVSTLKKALAKPTYENFLFSVFYRKCSKRSFSFNYDITAFPKFDTAMSNEVAVNKVIEGLEKDKPVMLTNICMEYVNNTCKASHSTVISGYRIVCKTGSNDCKKLFKVHNSWGEGWQKENNDGWVDADTLMLSIKQNNEKNPVLAESFIWLN